MRINLEIVRKFQIIEPSPVLSINNILSGKKVNLGKLNSYLQNKYLNAKKDTIHFCTTSTRTFSDAYYISGDFTKSLDYAKDVNKNQAKITFYLFQQNCAFTALKAISQGNISQTKKVKINDLMYGYYYTPGWNNGPVWIYHTYQKIVIPNFVKNDIRKIF